MAHFSSEMSVWWRHPSLLLFVPLTILAAFAAVSVPFFAADLDNFNQAWGELSMQAQFILSALLPYKPELKEVQPYLQLKPDQLFHEHALPWLFIVLAVIPVFFLSMTGATFHLANSREERFSSIVRHLLARKVTFLLPVSLLCIPGTLLTTHLIQKALPWELQLPDGLPVALTVFLCAYPLVLASESMSRCCLLLGKNGYTETVLGFVLGHALIFSWLYLNQQGIQAPVPLAFLISLPIVLLFDGIFFLYFKFKLAPRHPD